jgi:hypothetical protein
MNAVKLWLGLVGICAVFSAMGYVGYLVFSGVL